MKRSIALTALTTLFVTTGTGLAQEAVTIKLRERGNGDAAVVKRSENVVTKMTVTDGAGQVVLDNRELKTEIAEYTETILKREPGKLPTKLTRAYTKAQSGKDKKLDDLALAGKTVVIEKKGDKYGFTYKDGGELDGSALAALKKDFGKKTDSSAEIEKLVLPKSAVKPGESWKIDMAKIVAEIAKDGGMDLDTAKATGKGTLVKAYKKDGRQFGVMAFKMDVPIVSIGKGQGQLKFAAGAKITLDLTFDVCIDGTSETGEMKMTMKMGGNATFPSAPGATANMDVTVTVTQGQQEAAKK